MAKTQKPNKTQQTASSVTAFVNSIEDDAQRKDAKALLALMKRVTGSTPRMWGSSIVGFGTYHYKYATGREGDYCVTGFSPRKGTLTVYVSSGLHLQADNLKTLGKHTTGKSCIYIKKLSDVHLPTLEAVVRQGVADIRKLSPGVAL